MLSSTAAKRLLGRAVGPVIALLIVAMVLNLEGPAWLDRLMHTAQPDAKGLRAARKPTTSGPTGVPILVTPMKPMGNDSSVSPVPLRLILVETIPGRNRHEGYAKIGVNVLSPQTYSAGAILANGARLEEIGENFVVLERDGRSVRLDMQERLPRDATRTDPILSVGGPRATVSEPPISHESLTEFIRPDPVFVGNKLHGYVLHPGIQTSAFTEAGLQDGDILIQIDGQPVREAVQALQALETLTKGVALSVVIERRGGSMAMAIDGAAFVSAATRYRNSTISFKKNQTTI